MSERTNNNFLFGAAGSKEGLKRIQERAKLGRLYPSSKQELIALARASTVPVTICPPMLAPGAYDTEAERTNRVIGSESYRPNKGGM